MMNLWIEAYVSMPLPQQDEFGVNDEEKVLAIEVLSQCRFRSKMNSELVANVMTHPTVGRLNAASAAR